MPSVDEAKYNTKEKLRELIRRERGIEFAGEGVNATAADKMIENRVFKTTNRYLPIPQGARDANKQLKQNDGY